MQLVVQALPRTPCTQKGEGKTGEQGHRQGRLGAGGANPFEQGGGSLVMAESHSTLAVARGRSVEVDTGARWRVTARSCPMLSKAYGELNSALGGSTEQRRDRRWWAASDTDAEARRRRLGATRSGWRGQCRWRRSSSVDGSSNQRVQGGPGTAWGGLELWFTRVHGRCCEAS
jgi:hypothetical protein